MERTYFQRDDYLFDPITKPQAQINKKNEKRDIQVCSRLGSDDRVTWKDS